MGNNKYENCDRELFSFYKKILQINSRQVFRAISVTFEWNNLEEKKKFKIHRKKN